MSEVEDSITDMKNFVRQCILNYNELIDKTQGGDKSAGNFWDAVVITASDNDQKTAFDLQLAEKKRRNELPSSEYIIVPDEPPVPGCKIGSGGSTLLVIDSLYSKFGGSLADKKVLLIHAGGWSQRLPSASVLGKLFMPLPVGSENMDMLDLKLALYLPFLPLMTNGIFITASDDIELFAIDKELLNNLRAKQPKGVVALGHPSTIEIGTTHGVFVCSSELSSGSCLIPCQTVLQKPSVEELQKFGAVINNRSQNPFVITDSAYWIDAEVVAKLHAFHLQNGVPVCETDCYGDFMRPLGINPNGDYIETTKDSVLRHARRGLFDLLKGSQFQVLFLPKSGFFHLGTIAEYLENLTTDETFRTCLGIEKLQMHSSVSDSGRISSKSVLEFCDFGPNSVIGDNCFLSSCISDADAIIPPDTFLSTVAVTIDGNPYFVTLFCGVRDDIKRSSPKSDFKIFGKSYPELVPEIRALLDGSVNETSSTVSIWTAKLFIARRRPEEAFRSALETVNAIIATAKVSNADFHAEHPLLSMADALQLKNIEGTLTIRRRNRLTSTLPFGAERIFLSAVEAVKPTNLLRNKLQLDGNGVLRIRSFEGTERWSCVVKGNVKLLVVGKAATGMGSVLYDILKEHIMEGIVFAPTGSNLEDLAQLTDNKRMKVLFGGRDNLPDQDSISGTHQIVEFVRNVTPDELLLFAISGGASALLVAPTKPVTLSEKLWVIKNLAGRGATIQELNTVRGNLSDVKLGGLVSNLREGVSAISVVLSDIIGDPLGLIGSGPTVISTGLDRKTAQEILEKHDMWEAVPESIRHVLTCPFHRTFVSVPTNVLIGNNWTALQAAQSTAADLGLQTLVLTRSLCGEAQEQGYLFAKLAQAVMEYRSGETDDHTSINEVLALFPDRTDIGKSEHFDWNAPFCVLSGGESTVTLKGAGKGGRNQELVLAFAIACRELGVSESNVRGAFVSAGTDGQDGPTDAAGAVVKMPIKMEKELLEARTALQNNDSYRFFDEFGTQLALGGLIRTGLTGTNVMDIQILIMV